MRLKGNRCGRQASKLQTTKLEAMSSKSQHVASLKFSLSLSLRANQIEKLLLLHSETIIMPPKGNRCGRRQAGRQAGTDQGFKTNMSLESTNLQQRIRPRFVGANPRKTKKTRQNKTKDFVARNLYQRQLFPTTRMTQPRGRIESVQL
jgi:hypothetical protein